jgi:hypothetical protein
MNAILDFAGLFILIAGFVVGLGAVTVIDLHGFLGRKSPYWTEATVRTHKVTKPLIWLGTSLVIIGGTINFRDVEYVGIPLYLSVIAIVLILNGLFLSFRVSPYLLEKERAGLSRELLPSYWQKRIMVSLIFSDLGWWGALAMTVYYLTNR